MDQEFFWIMTKISVKYLLRYPQYLLCNPYTILPNLRMNFVLVNFYILYFLFSGGLSISVTRQLHWKIIVVLAFHLQVSKQNNKKRPKWPKFSCLTAMKTSWYYILSMSNQAPNNFTLLFQSFQILLAAAINFPSSGDKNLN